MTIQQLLNSDSGKTVSQYGFVRVHPSAAAKMFASGKGHMIVTARFTRNSDSRTFYPFANDRGNKLYPAYAHSVFSRELIVEVFGHDKKRKNWEVRLGWFWD